MMFGSQEAKAVNQRNTVGDTRNVNDSSLVAQ